MTETDRPTHWYRTIGTATRTEQDTTLQTLAAHVGALADQAFGEIAAKYANTEMTVAEFVSAVAEPREMMIRVTVEVWEPNHAMNALHQSR